jgi:hypothetical protein
LTQEPQDCRHADRAGAAGADRRCGAYDRSSCASSPRAVTPAFVKMFRKWKATVRCDTQHLAAMSLLDMPWPTNSATAAPSG